MRGVAVGTDVHHVGTVHEGALGCLRALAVRSPHEGRALRTALLQAGGHADIPAAHADLPLAIGDGPLREHRGSRDGRPLETARRHGPGRVDGPDFDVRAPTQIRLFPAVADLTLGEGLAVDEPEHAVVEVDARPTRPQRAALLAREHQIRHPQPEPVDVPVDRLPDQRSGDLAAEHRGVTVEGVPLVQPGDVEAKAHERHLESRLHRYRQPLDRPPVGGDVTPIGLGRDAVLLQRFAQHALHLVEDVLRRAGYIDPFHDGVRPRAHGVLGRTSQPGHPAEPDPIGMLRTPRDLVDHAEDHAVCRPGGRRVAHAQRGAPRRTIDLAHGIAQVLHLRRARLDACPLVQEDLCLLPPTERLDARLTHRHLPGGAGVFEHTTRGRLERLRAPFEAAPFDALQQQRAAAGVGGALQRRHAPPAGVATVALEAFAVLGAGQPDLIVGEAGAVEAPLSGIAVVHVDARSAGREPFVGAAVVDAQLPGRAVGVFDAQIVAATTEPALTATAAFAAGPTVGVRHADVVDADAPFQARHVAAVAVDLDALPTGARLPVRAHADGSFLARLPVRVVGIGKTTAPLEADLQIEEAVSVRIARIAAAARGQRGRGRLDRLAAERERHDAEQQPEHPAVRVRHASHGEPPFSSVVFSSGEDAPEARIDLGRGLSFSQVM